MSTANLKFPAVELQNINKEDDLKIAPFRADGITYGTPTWIWAVVVNGDLFVRAYNGIGSRWYQSAITQKAGRIHAAGMIKDVRFEIVDGDLNKQIDEAYKIKYSKSPYLSSMISNRAAESTIKVIPVK